MYGVIIYYTIKTTPVYSTKVCCALEEYETRFGSNHINYTYYKKREKKKKEKLEVQQGNKEIAKLP